jgi:hypothetical protein
MRLNRVVTLLSQAMAEIKVGLCKIGLIFQKFLAERISTLPVQGTVSG